MHAVPVEPAEGRGEHPLCHYPAGPPVLVNDEVLIDLTVFRRLAVEVYGPGVGAYRMTGSEDPGDVELYRETYCWHGRTAACSEMPVFIIRIS